VTDSLVKRLEAHGTCESSGTQGQTAEAKRSIGAQHNTHRLLRAEPERDGAPLPQAATPAPEPRSGPVASTSKASPTISQPEGPSASFSLVQD
jgi:hypothetical protein